MKSFIMIAAFFVSSLALADDCFNANFVHGWDYDNHSEVLKVESFSDVYELKMNFSCHELPWASAIGFRTFGGSFVCSGDQVVVYNAWNEPVQLCRITSVKKTK